MKSLESNARNALEITSLKLITVTLGGHSG